MNAQTLQAELDKILTDAVSNGDVAHVAGIVTNADGVLYQGQIGPRLMGESAPLKEDTVYWIRSMTKPLTASCVMQQVEQGRIKLDDDCGELVPALASPQVLEGFDADGNPKLRPARGQITLRRLLTHTAGFVYDNWNPEHRDWMKHSGIERRDFYDLPENCPPLGFDPGTRWEYGINIDWSARVLEALTGETLEAYMRTRVLEPLGMSSTGYMLTDPIRARFSGVHQRGADGLIRAADETLPTAQDPRDFKGGGELYGTAGDYARFMRMILNRGELEGVRILAPETVRMMSENQMGDIPVVRMPAAIPENTFPVNLYPDVEKRWGLSFMIVMEDLPGRRRAGSLSWAGLQNTYFWIDPKSGLAGAVFTQMKPFADPKTLALLDRFETAVYATI